MSPDPEDDDDPTDDFAGEVADVQANPPPLASPGAVAGIWARLDVRPPQPAAYGRYEVVGEIGSGGMGAVYRACDHHLGRDVALKVILPTLVKDPGFRQRFRDEAQALARISSRHVVPVYDVEPAGDRPYLVMELLPGATLEDWLRCRPLPAPAADLWWVAGEVLTGLVDIHAAGIPVHADLKPQNLWVRRQVGRDPARVVVLDFGAYRRAAVDATGGPGTPKYMPPEQARSEPIDARADLFAVGAVLYRMVVGLPPDSGPDRDNSALEALPPQLSGFIRTLLHPKPEGRPANAAAALAMLNKAREEADRAEADRRTAAAKLQPIAARAVKAEADRRLWVWLTASAAACLVVVAAGWWWDWYAADRRAAVRKTAAEERVVELEATLGRVRVADKKVDEAREALGRAFKEVDARTLELARTAEQPEATRKKVQDEYSRVATDCHNALARVQQALAERAALLDPLAADGGR